VGGLIAWPQRSHSLPPPRFLFLGMLGQKVYVMEVWNRDKPINPIEVAAAGIRTLPRQLITVRSST
jgi:hypothetical protein